MNPSSTLVLGFESSCDETGVALVFLSFCIVLYREEIIPGWLLMIGISAAVLFVVSLLVPKMILVTSLLVLAALIVLLFRKWKTFFVVAGLVAICIGNIQFHWVHCGSLV